MMRYTYLKGTSLVEVLVTVLILTFIVTLASQAFVAINYTSLVVNDTTVIHDKARTAQTILVSDMAKAGRGFQDLSQMDLWFDNGSGPSPMLMINNLTVDVNGFSDITIHYFDYDPTDSKNTSFLVDNSSGTPFGSQLILYGENEFGELDQLEDRDLYIVYQYSGLATPELFDGSRTESYWNIPDVENSAVILQLSPASSPTLIDDNETNTNYSIAMDYVTDGFLLSATSHWKEQDLPPAGEIYQPVNRLQEFFKNTRSFRIKENMLSSLVFARRIGSSEAFRSVRYFVNNLNQLVRSDSNNDIVIIDKVETFKISLGLDTNITDAELVLAADLNGSVTPGTTFDPDSRWLDDISSGDDAVLANRHALAMRINLAVNSDVVDRTRLESGDNQVNKRIQFETILRLNNSLPRGDFSVLPAE